jgi:hypothetical protein
MLLIVEGQEQHAETPQDLLEPFADHRWFG